MTKHFALTALALTCIAATPVAAQSGGFTPQYQPGFTPSFMQPSLEQKKKERGDHIHTSTEVIPDEVYRISFVRLPGSAPGDITLRVSSPGSVTGCLKMVQPQFFKKPMGARLNIELSKSRLNIDDGERQYAQHNCKISTAKSSIDIPLSRDELVAYGTEKIAIRAENVGTFMHIKVNIDEDKAYFVADPADLANMGQPFINDANKFVHWFYPENTLTLYNPQIDLDEETAQKIANAAMAKGLRPLTEYFPEFRTTEKTKNKLYFVDEGNLFTQNLSEPNDITTIGNIEITKLYHGPDGPYERTIAKPIFARKPLPTE